ncbi:MAG: hypothetical protein K2M15_03930 [Oscillospiraceae bacterium]|nr:hypothetical protein [Oscillospiraceae bacterium]MDE7170963.1 hypothetical protein [Oscillospiraceae bacterium]
MKSKAPLAMMEQIVMLLVFALAAALCLQAFVKSDQLSKHSEARDHAAVLCQNAAEVLRSAKGETWAVSAALDCPYPYGYTRMPLAIYYDDNWDMVIDTEGAYCLKVEPLDGSGIPGLGKGYVAVTATDTGEILFELDVAWQEEVGAHG